jgi:hypothetical protein
MLLALGACGGGGGANGQTSDSGSATAADSNTSASLADEEKRRRDSTTAPVSSSPDAGTVPAPTTSPSVPVASGGTAVSGDVVDSSGKVDPNAYTAMAQQMSTDVGIAYRYGAASTTPRAGTPTWHERSSTTYTMTQRPAGEIGNMGQWQVGGPATTDAGDYFSNMGNVLYVADSTARTGVADIGTISQQHNTFAQKPELPWVLRNHLGGGVDDFHAMEGKLSKPVAAARCYGRPGWCLESVVAYQDGTLSTAYGSNTAQNRALTKLAPGKVPTAITITNGNEFALVTVWDTARTRGQIAVVALAALGAGCSVTTPDCGDTGWGDWGAVHPGLANLGNMAYMKVLGYIDLPEGVRAPTEISATTGWNPWDGRIRNDWGGESSAYKMPLADEANRQTFISGTNVNAYAKAGVAVVVSKSEKRATFVDLKPLFDYYRSMYFGSSTNFNATRTIGAADNQWPFTFANTPSQAPTVITTLDLPNAPTAVKASTWGPNARAWIATQEGHLRLFNLGNYAQPSGTSTPADIQQVGTIAVGANPTSLSYSRGILNDTKEHSDELLVLSRAEKRVDWIKLSADRNSGSITKTLMDSRMVDPIAIEDNENHGTHGLVVSVADYSASTVRNYRYSNVIFWTNQDGGDACQPPNGCGMGSGGSDAFEYGGHLELPASLVYSDGTKAPTLLPGKPFMVTSGNVP